MIVRTYHTEVRRRWVAPVPVPARTPTNVSGPWTAEEAATLNALRSDGWSYSGIARKLGRTRSSVMGFDWRRQQR